MKKSLLRRVAFVVFITFIFLINTFHEKYPDEFDNILGGWYIINGKLPYTGFFTHHGPVPYFISSFINILSGQSFVKFRFFYALFLIIITFGSYLFLKRRLGEKLINFYPFFIIFLGIISTYYWLHMILADNIAAFSYLPVYALIIIKWFYKKKIGLIDVTAISLLSAVGFYSSLTYTYVFIITTLATLYLYYKDHFPVKNFFIKNSLYPIAVFAAPHLLFLLYLVLTQSISDYIYQNFVFNAKYYIYNYPRPADSEFINPARYALLIANYFFVNFYTLLLGVKSLDFAFPVNVTMAISNVGLLIFFLFRKEYKLAGFIFLFLIYTTARSNPITSKETDYQSAVYNVISFFNLFFLIPLLYKYINEKVELAQKLIFSLLFIIISLYSFFSISHLILKFNSKAMGKYMGDAPLIYDRPELAPIINTVASKDEYVWVGPFEFEDLFYINGKMPSKYHILIYGIGASEKIKGELLSDLQKNMPKVIMFDRQFSYLGKGVESYSGFFLDFLDKNYIQLLYYQDGKYKYRSVAPIEKEGKVDIEKKLYIRRDKVNEVVEKLLEKNYIKAENI